KLVDATCRECVECRVCNEFDRSPVCVDGASGVVASKCVKVWIVSGQENRAHWTYGLLSRRAGIGVDGQKGGRPGLDVETVGQRSHLGPRNHRDRAPTNGGGGVNVQDNS